MILFLVSSAIHVKHGIYSSKDRISQTVKTLNSIRDKVEDAHIFLLDGGYKCPTTDELRAVTDICDVFNCFANAEQVSKTQEINNQDIVKNMIELIMYGAFLNAMHEQVSHYHRVFKMSGRYQLTNMFDAKQHIGDRPVVAKRRPSQFKPEITGGVKWQYMSRLWSWSGKHTNTIGKCYTEMLKHMDERLQAGGYIDIEHLLYEHLPNPKQIPIIGVEGNISPNGVRVSD